MSSHVNKTRAKVIGMALVFILVTMMSANIVASLSTFKETLKETIRQEWRLQARTTLTNLKYQYKIDSDNGLVVSSNDLSIQKWSTIRLSGVRNGGPTGDGFVVMFSPKYGLKKGKFLFDASGDCALTDVESDSKYLTDLLITQNQSKTYLSNKGKELNDTTLLNMSKEEIIDYSDVQMIQTKYPDLYKELKNRNIIMFNEPLSEQKALSNMELLQDTKSNDNYTWKFDDSTELLEWIVIPDSLYGFNGEPNTNGGVENPNYSKLLIQLGTQEDEIFKPYQSVFNILDTTIKTVYIAIFVLLAVFIYLIFSLTYYSIKIRPHLP